MCEWSNPWGGYIYIKLYILNPKIKKNKKISGVGFYDEYLLLSALFSILPPFPPPFKMFIPASIFDLSALPEKEYKIHCLSRERKSKRERFPREETDCFNGFCSDSAYQYQGRGDWKLYSRLPLSPLLFFFVFSTFCPPLIILWTDVYLVLVFGSVNWLWFSFFLWSSQLWDNNTIDEHVNVYISLWWCNLLMLHVCIGRKQANYDVFIWNSLSDQMCFNVP